MGTLYIVATPIGNLGDISVRATKTLEAVDYIACEDTRRTGQLLHSLNISARQLLRYDDHTEQTATPELLSYLTEGKSIALVSDAGTPLISDPGYVLVREARKRSIPVVSVPGASAVLAALTSSGLPSDKFLFLGYPPEKQSHRLKLFQSLFQCINTSEQNFTVIFYSSPHKLQSLLKDMKTIFGDIEIAISRELTKIHEETWRGTITDAQQYFIGPKGEIVLLFRLSD